MKSVLIVAHFSGQLNNTDNNRFIYLAKLLSRCGFEVSFITTDFSHSEKVHKKLGDLDVKDLDISLIHESGYKKNISFKRLLSHKEMGKNLKKYLYHIDKPDLVYCAIPSLSVGKIASEYAKENTIPFVIDIQDLWPQAFKMAIGQNIITDIILKPLQNVAAKIYQAADGIIAVSQTYYSVARKLNKYAIGNTVYLGTDLQYFDYVASRVAKENKNDEIWLAYVGTLGNSYDLNTVFKALSILKKEKKNSKKVKFIVMGDGPLATKFKHEANKYSIDVLFTGKLEYDKMVGMLTQCDIAINPIVGKSAASIINKHADYAAAGLPVINTQESEEYKTLVDKYEFGVNCKNSDPKDVAFNLSLLINDEELRARMATNSRRCAEENFNREVSYNKIVEVIDELI